MIINHLAILTALVLVGSSDRQTTHTTKSLTLTLKGEITPDTSIATDIALARVQGLTTVNILIDSPGGVVGTTMEIIEEMELAQKQGMTIVCTVINLAASAAFLVFNTCDVRQVYRTSRLMWHSVGTDVASFMNIPSLKALLSELEALQFWANERIQAKLKLNPVLFERLWLMEITLTGADLYALAPHYVTLIKE